MTTKKSQSSAKVITTASVEIAEALFEFSKSKTSDDLSTNLMG